MPRLRKGKTRSGRKIKLTDRSKERLEVQLADFRKKFGRDPVGDEHVFFDPNADKPRPIEDGHSHSVMMEALVGSGVDMGT